MPIMLPLLDPASTVPASEHCPPDWLEDEAMANLQPKANCRQWIEQLLQSEQSAEALRLISRILPKRYAIAWCCECMRTLHANEALPAREVDRAGIVLAERWLTQPTEEHRRAALEFAERGDFSAAGAWVAAAAGWAEGSLAPKDLEPVPPPDTLSGEAVFAALLITAVTQPEQRDARIRSFIQSALNSFGALTTGKVHS